MRESPLTFLGWGRKPQIQAAEDLPAGEKMWDGEEAVFLPQVCVSGVWWSHKNGNSSIRGMFATREKTKVMLTTHGVSDLCEHLRYCYFSNPGRSHHYPSFYT